MKGNNGTGNNQERDEWQTPKQLFNELDKQYPFVFDCCAKKSNSKKPMFSCEFDKLDNLSPYMCWMNPPFSKAEIMFKQFFKIVSFGIAIYRCDNFETKIWQEVIFPNASWIFIPNKRIAYEGMNGNGSRFPSALIGFNVKPIRNIEGITLFVNSKNEVK